MRGIVITCVSFCVPTLLAQGVGVGTRIDLTAKLNLNDGTTGQFAQLFIPDYYIAPPDGNFTLVVHLHSASWAAEDEVYRSHVNAVLFNIHLGGFSSSYQSWFSTSARFQNVLDTVVAVLRTNNIIPNAQIRRLIVTSFSAGYAGVREMFKSPSYYSRISALTLADGLHCNSDSATMRVQMQDFLRFARDARDRRKVFLLTHSNIQTSGYENTTATATYLINNIGTARQPINSVDEIGTQYSRSDTGHFHVKGYLGTTATDHLKHLYGMHLMLGRAVSLLDSVATEVEENTQKPEGFRLEQNFPNPFNPTTNIGFQIPDVSAASGFTSGGRFVSLKIYDGVGEEVATIVNEFMPPGKHHTNWNASAFASGVYYYRLMTNNFAQTRKLMLVR